MKTTKLVIAIALVATMAACSQEEDRAPDPQPEQGLQFTTKTADTLVGTYTVADEAIAFESIIVDDTYRVLRISTIDGEELVRLEVGPTQAETDLYHYGVKLDDWYATPDQAPEMVQWYASDEIQLVASLWRDIIDTPLMDLPSATKLMEYGIHLDEVLGKFAAEANGESPPEGYPDEAEHRCEDCAGACGPSCWAIGSLWYCRVHDCCCDHYGGWACATWCLVYPKCGHAGCY